MSIGQVVSGVIFFGLATAWGAAQAPADRDQSEVTSNQSPVTFSSRTDLVSVPVVVRDAKGNAVGNLHQSDFRLFDNGKQQTIVQFSMQSRTHQAGAPSRSSGVKANDEASANLTGLRAEVLPAAYIAYVFDDIHMNFADIASMRNAAEKHFQSLAADSRAAIFTTSGRVFQDFTGDRAKLRDALLRIGPGPNALPPIPADGEKSGVICPPYVTAYTADLALNVMDPAAMTSAEAAAVACWGPDPSPPSMGRMAALQVLSANTVNVKATFDSLNSLVKRLSVVPGLRSIVLISSGFFLTKDLGPVETPLMEAAIRAKVAINALDARGVYISNRRNEDLEGDAMRELAAGTGGRFFEHDNGLLEGLNLLAARPEYSYVMAFSPQNLKLDGQYHTLKVSLVNSRGLGVQARRGYWAPDHAADEAEQAREEIREAVFSLDEMNSIPLDVTSEFFKQSDAAAELTVQYRLDLNAVHFEHADNRDTEKFTVVTGVFDQDGHYLRGIQRIIDLHLREQTLQQLLTSGLAARETFDIQPGRYVVRVVVRDSAGDMMSARNATVTIP